MQEELKLINMHDVEVSEVHWLWYPYIPAGKITIIQGDPGVGKTTMILGITAAITKGLLLPETETIIGPANVIYQTAEDGLNDTIKPRLLQAGADCKLIDVIDETSYTYNKANRVMSLENKRQGSVISAWKYGYDRGGNMVSKTNQTSSNPVTISYRYDRLGRLTEEDYSGWKRSFYEYNACSNRTKMMVEGKTKDELVSVTSYEYGLNNRLEKEVRKQGKETETWKYRYDDNGNETFRIWEKTSPAPEYPGSVKLSGSWKREVPTVYEWRHYNGFHQLIRVNQDDKEIVYQYRGDGLRHSSEVRELTGSQSKTKVCYWDGADIVAEQADGGSVKRYLRGINLLAGEADGMVYYYILNEHGDVAQLWGQSGTCKALYEYDAFGNERNPEKGDENPFRYCGEYYDLSSGTYYLRNRYYNPINGRFLTEDPIRDGLNWYTYCANNPIMFIDPLGLALLQQYVEDNKGTVTWDDKTKTVTATVNGITRSFTEGTYGIFINRNGRMDVPDDILEVAFTKASKIIDCTKDYLVSSSSKFGANSQTVASVIFTEQHYNVDWKDYTLDIYAGFIGIDTSNGTGQVKISTAKFLEDKGYMDRTKGTVFSSRNEKILIKLWDDEINVNYTTAYLKYFQDTWQAAYPNISNDPAILGSLYNLGHSKTPHANPQSNWFGDYVQQHYNAMSYLLGL